MPRNLDLSSLRSFVTVADVGGVTRAAGYLNLTQSAVSMQIKRLEESLGMSLFLRAARKLALSPEGEQLLSYGRRMLALNDEALARLTSSSFEGEIRLGVPHDIVYPAIPGILKRLSGQFPRMRINLVSSFTILLKEQFQRGELDLILTTEDVPGAGAEELGVRPLVWVGAEEGQAWQKRPLRIGFKDTCIFRRRAVAALTAAGVPWEMAVLGESEQAIEATVAADLAVTARLTNAMPQGLYPMDTKGQLPDLGTQTICLYAAPTLRGEAAELLMQEIRNAYCC